MCRGGVSLGSRNYINYIFAHGLEGHIHTHCSWSPGFAVCVATKAFLEAQAHQSPRKKKGSRSRSEDLEQVVRIKVRRIHESGMRLPCIRFDPEGGPWNSMGGRWL